MNKRIMFYLFILLLPFALILVTGFIDLSNLDKLIASNIFKQNNWDLNFYSIATILTSIIIPLVAILITKTYKRQKDSDYWHNSISEFISKLYKIRNSTSFLLNSPPNITSDTNLSKNAFYKSGEDVDTLQEEYGRVSLFSCENKSLEEEIIAFQILIYKTNSIWYEVFVLRNNNVENQFEQEKAAFLNESGKLLDSIKRKYWELLKNL